MNDQDQYLCVISFSPVGSSGGIYLFRCQYLARDLVSFIVAKLTEQEPAAFILNLFLLGCLVSLFRGFAGMWQRNTMRLMTGYLPYHWLTF